MYFEIIEENGHSAQAGIQVSLHLDSRLRGNDEGFTSSSIVVLDSTDQTSSHGFYRRSAMA